MAAPKPLNPSQFLNAQAQTIPESRKKIIIFRWYFRWYLVNLVNFSPKSQLFPKFPSFPQVSTGFHPEKPRLRPGQPWPPRELVGRQGLEVSHHHQATPRARDGDVEASGIAQETHLATGVGTYRAHQNQVLKKTGMKNEWKIEIEWKCWDKWMKNGWRMVLEWGCFGMGEWDCAASASHPGKKNQELVPGKMMKCTCDHPGIATASSQNQAAFQHLQSSQLPSCPISHLFIPFFLTGAKRREWMGMGLAGRIITIIPSFFPFFHPIFPNFSPHFSGPFHVPGSHPHCWPPPMPRPRPLRAPVCPAPGSPGAGGWAAPAPRRAWWRRSPRDWCRSRPGHSAAGPMVGRCGKLVDRKYWTCILMIIDIFIFHVYWCILMYIDVYWCILMYIDVYWCIFILMYNVYCSKNLEDVFCEYTYYIFILWKWWEYRTSRASTSVSLSQEVPSEVSFPDVIGWLVGREIGWIFQICCVSISDLMIQQNNKIQ